jgi:aspartate aminotransferase
VGGTENSRTPSSGSWNGKTGFPYRRKENRRVLRSEESLYNIAQALFEEGDEVIVPAPYWVSYPDIVVPRRRYGDAVILSTREEDGFKMTRRR